MSKGATFISFITFILLSLLYLALTFMEATHFRGYILGTFNLSLKIVFVLILFFGSSAEFGLYVWTERKENLELLKTLLMIRATIFYLNKRTIFILFILSSVYLFIHKNLYIDFVKSQIGIDPYYFFHIIGLSLFFFAISKISPIHSEKIRLNRVWVLIVNKFIFNKFVVEIFLLAMLVLSAVVFFYSGTSQWWFQNILKHPLASNDQKMQDIYGTFYSYMKFVNFNTPTDAVILRMQQGSKWPWLSNDPFTRYFIYPRYTKEGDKNSLNDPAVKYVFIHKKYIASIDGYDGDRWPDFKVPTKRILYMRDDSTLAPIVVYSDYDPSDKTYERYWGLIELKRN